MLHIDRVARHILLILALTCTGVSISGQSAAPLTCATPDGDIIIPIKTGILGQKDPGAIAELTAHLAAVGGGPWTGMQGIGHIKYGADATVYDAALSTAHSDSFRLDAATKSGQMGIRIHGLIGAMQASDGNKSALPPETALSGLFPFAFARMDLSSQAAASLSFLDRGITVIGSSSLHRITVEFPALGSNPSTKTQNTHVIDLYFDPTTHLLVKSVAFDSLVNTRRVFFVFVITYSDYRAVGNALVPFHYAETMEGQPYWDLQLSNAQINATLTSTNFEF